MRIGVFEHGWWRRACEAGRYVVIDLPVAEVAGDNAHRADLASRMRQGEAVRARVADGKTPEEHVDFLLDNSGTGLTFVDPGLPTAELRLTHEALGVPLVSHFIDPIPTAFQGLDYTVLWQSLHCPTWVKAVWDRAQAQELRGFGVPGVMHLPMAAPNRAYDTTPLDAARQRTVVSFVGGQNSTWFQGRQGVLTGSLFAGALGQIACHADESLSFFDMYHHRFGLGGGVQTGDNVATQVQKTATYFEHKLFFHAMQNLRNRDRYVLFLTRHLGERFELRGTGWDRAYGLAALPMLPTYDEYLRHFRETAINLNLVNGNSETGLNMRHFEITAAGGFLLCPDHPELSECFEVGRECAAFQNERDLAEKIAHYLAHPDERAEIAAAGQRRTLSEHLYSHRLDTLLRALPNLLMTLEFSSRHWAEDAKQFVPEARVILDCGANVGQMAESFRIHYPKAEIYSFEPVSAVYAALAEKCRVLKATPVKKAVSDRDGTAVIHLTAGREAHSLLGFQGGNPCARWTREVGTEEVEVCTLDRWCVNAGVDPRRVDLIKLDIQGAELQALYGARRLLASTPLILLEVSFVPIYKDAPLFAEVDRFLRECGYRRHAVYPSDQPQHWADALYVKG